jgi:ribosome biogenesis protein ERB1
VPPAAGHKLLRKQRGDKLDALLARNDSRKALRTIYDEYNDEEIVLSKEELEMIMRIRWGGGGSG